MTTMPTPIPIADRPAGEITGGDMFLTLTGFDEIAVAKAFGSDIAELREAPMRFLRALAFVHQRRAGAKDGEAFKTAMTMTIAEVGNYFADDEPDPIDPDDPESDEGKDDAPSS